MKISYAIIEWRDEVDVDGGACDEMRELADLIGLQKAKREDAGDYWRCGHCGAFSRKDAVADCFGVIPMRCCGNCGREWDE